MSVSRADALLSARKLLRTFASAPDPKQRARAICSALANTADWTAAERAAIDTVGAWLQAYPPAAEMKPRCEQLVARLR